MNKLDKLAYSAGETATLLSISKAHVHRLINSGIIRTIKLGQRKVITAAELERLITGQPHNMDCKRGGVDE